MAHFNGWLRVGAARSVPLLHYNGPALDDDIKIVTGLALLYNRLSVLKATRLQGIRNSIPLPLFQALCIIIKFLIERNFVKKEEEEESYLGLKLWRGTPHTSSSCG